MAAIGLVDKTLNWSLFCKILLFWFLTIPATAVISGYKIILSNTSFNSFTALKPSQLHTNFTLKGAYIFNTIKLLH
jgi:hypothetical protein